MTSEVPQQPNLQLPLAKPLDRRALVDYIQGTPGLQETDYLEWKVGYDLSRRPVAAQVAKHLIGFANRKRSRRRLTISRPSKRALRLAHRLVLDSMSG